MKYTRYTYGGKKRGGKGKNTLIVIGLLVVAVVTGTVFSKLLIKDNIKESGIDNKSIVNKDEKERNDVKPAEGQNKPKLYAVQCGYFAKKENVDELLGKLKPKYGGFMVEEGDKFRVFVGIYEEGKVDEKIKELTGDGYNAMKVDITAKPSKDSYNVIYEISAAQIKLLSKLDDKNIKSINTDEFKKWVGDINVLGEGDAYFKQFSDTKNMVMALPKDLTKEKKDELYRSIYSILKSIK